MQISIYPDKTPNKKIKILISIFNFEIERREIPAFRGAVIEKVGQENLLFHNHLGKDFRYGYPLIQYKLIRKKPAIVCINEGSEEIVKFFENIDWDLTLNGEKIHAEIKHLSFDYFHCGFSDELKTYEIKNWFALNEENFEKFMRLDKESNRLEFLERILIGNILSFAKGVGWNVAQQIKTKITQISDYRAFNFKNQQMLGFDIKFTSNITLPDHIGLGKSVSRGFGVIRKAAEK